jgi:hypothetical protein
MGLSVERFEGSCLGSSYCRTIRFDAICNAALYRFLLASHYTIRCIVDKH